ncbi:MAG: hypothetical protein ABSB80_02190 [Methanoregula sp.]|jgi:hypothetical protein|uniref:Eco57I restriction-modification methylase domain-containing protein n=1 Tax=Methanoregula sp. TaxID=2052170 RepID=UPI003D11830B
MPRPDPAPCEEPDTNAGNHAETVLFHDLTCWREQLARSIARNNLGLRSEQIATATNRVIFSLLFLRMAEDRGLVAGGTLQQISDSADHYGQLLEASSSLSGLWEERDNPSSAPPVSMGSLIIEDSVISAVLSRLISGDRPYHFDTLDLEVIAGVLGHYISRTVRRSAAHQATVVDTHDAVLSRGLTAPPLSVIRYMATRSLGAAIANRSPCDVLPLRVLDPACGAGTVLLCVFRALLASQGNRLTFDECHSILVDSIYGVDISRHAVVATKMLLLFRLFGEFSSSPAPQDIPGIIEGLFRDLRHTIRCGNALIAPDIVNDESWMFCPARERHLLNPFAWAAEFPEIFAAGGFDMVISNPPEGLPEQKEWIQRYLQRHYAAYHPEADRSAFFIEKGLVLLRPGGSLNFTMSDLWLRGRAGSPLRYLLTTKQVEEIVDLPGSVGGPDETGTCILRLTNHSPSHAAVAALVDPASPGDLEAYVHAHHFPVDQANFGEGGWTLRDKRTEEVLEKIRESGSPLEDYVMGQFRPGTEWASDPAFVIDSSLRKTLISGDPECKKFIRPVISGETIGRYEPAVHISFAVFIPQGWTDHYPGARSSPWRWFKRRHPVLARFLKSRKSTKAEEAPDHWWETACSDDFWREQHPKILFANRFQELAFGFDPGRGIAGPSVGALASSSLYLLGLLNSRLISFVFERTVRSSFRNRTEFSGDDLMDIPVYTPDFDNPDDKARHDRMVALVTEMLELHKHLSHAKSDQEKRIITQEIESIDRQIDSLVYGLYGLTADEVAVVEANSA